MQNFKQEQNSDEKKVREYINKYIKELQRHFDMSDRKMRIILYKVYKDLSPFAFLGIFMKNWFCMLKSFCNKLKRKHHGD